MPASPFPLDPSQKHNVTTGFKQAADSSPAFPLTLEGPRLHLFQVQPAHGFHTLSLTHSPPGHLFHAPTVQWRRQASASLRWAKLFRRGHQEPLGSQREAPSLTQAIRGGFQEERTSETIEMRKESASHGKGAGKFDSQISNK